MASGQEQILQHIKMSSVLAVMEGYAPHAWPGSVHADVTHKNCYQLSPFTNNMFYYGVREVVVIRIIIIHCIKDPCPIK